MSREANIRPTGGIRQGPLSRLVFALSIYIILRSARAGFRAQPSPFPRIFLCYMSVNRYLPGLVLASS